MSMFATLGAAASIAAGSLLVGDPNAQPALVLLQGTAVKVRHEKHPHHHKKNQSHVVSYGEEDEHGIYNFAEVGGDSWLTAPDTDLDADVCGFRPMMPQLQFEIEVYKHLGLLHSSYARCRVPSTRSFLSITSFDSTSAYVQAETFAHMSPHVSGNVRAKCARLVVIFWAVAAIYTMMSFVVGTFRRVRPKKVAAIVETYATSVKKPVDVPAVQAAMTHRLGGFSLTWLDPIIGLYSSRTAPEINQKEINELEPDFQIEPYAAFRKAWQEEVAAKGLEDADLFTVLRRFLGPEVVLKMVGAVSLTAALELSGMTAVLDLLLNYLRWASDAHARLPFVSLDTLGPSVMVIVLGMGVPMATRYCSSMASVSDGYNNNRIVAGLLSVVHEKCQKLPMTDTRSDNEGTARIDVNQLVSNDVIKVWNGALKSYVQLMVYPMVMLVFFGVLAHRLRSAAVFGAAAVLWISILYIPGLRLIRRGNSRWLQLADVRARLMKETIFNICSVKAMANERALSDRIYHVREQELQTKLGFSMVQSLMNVPVNLLPFALVCSSLIFHTAMYGPIETKDIFVCMQVLSGLVACSTAFGAALQRTVNIPNSVRRIERFLKEPEKPKKPKQEDARHPSAPVAQISGSFAFGPNEQPVLHDIDLSVHKGELVAVVGEVASGKSALLAAMLGELNSTDDEALVDVPDHIAYCSQTPWMIDGLLHENITLGEKIEQQRYKDSLAVANLAAKSATEVKISEMPASAGVQTKEQRQHRLESQPEEAQPAPYLYFTMWNVLVFIALTLGVINVDWRKTPIFLGLLIVVIQGLLHWSVMEIPLQTIACFFTKEPPKPKRADGSHLTLCLNYNLLAVGHADINECMQNMYEAYMGSISETVSAVLVSATNDPDLKDYELQVRDECRERIYKELVHEGLVWAGFERGTVDDGRRERVWSKFKGLDKQEFAQVHLNPLCKRFANEFMVLHRVSRVLRKCGQYQDLMLLSEGMDRAFTYCDTALYREAARSLGEPLFHPSTDTENVCGRHFDYTLVLDADTCVVKDSVFEMMEIGAGNPDRAIIQPSIQMDCKPGDSIFIHIEAMRQAIAAPLTNTLTAILGECGFYGKGLLKNTAYIEKCLGTPEKPIEVVPIDVLSHDTFEAAVVGPLYAGDVSLLEAPCGNYVTWDIRERRWNRGEILLAMYFFPETIGRAFRFIQSKLQGKEFRVTQVRTKAELGDISEYLAHSALRQIVLKPMLVMYIILMDFVEMHYEWTPIIVVMFLIIVFPKFVTCRKDNWRAVMLETFASILQFTPECVVGTIRILRALKAHLTGNARWVPQRAVEEEFEKSNPFVFSLNYMWYYPAFALVAGFVVASLIPDGIFIMWMLGTLLALPFYAGFTALKTRSEDDPSVFPYFSLWNVFTVITIILSFCNVNWSRTSAIMGVVVVGIQGVLHWSVMEIPLQTIATFFTKTAPKPKRADGTHLSMCLNYNLLAVSQADIDECLQNQYDAFMGNIAENVSAVLVSATNDPELKEYELKVRDEFREKIYQDLYHEGLVWAGFEHKGKVDPGRHRRVWSKFQHADRQEFRDVHLHNTCQSFAKEFMVLHRVSRVLRKCGQYQDLMLLSTGYEKAFTYCDSSLYKEAARPLGEPLFHASEDRDNVIGRKFDYTLVLDADTCVVPDSAFELLDIGAGNPERAIIQPSITMDCKPGDSIFIHIEAMRQSINAPLTNTLTALISESGFYGKGLLKNEVYIEKCLGTPEHPIEVVPIDVLSHDTFEAAVVGPLYAGDVALLEAPCGNYVTWDIRERRWNRGEILLAMYFFPEYVGKPMRWLQSKLQGKQFSATEVRTKAQLSPISEYLAHSALRQIVLKPVLVSYIIMMDFVEMYYEWTPFVIAMFLIIVFPKFATCNSGNVRAVILETTASILQFTPECVVGTIRILRALKAHLTGNAKWIPQRAVEEEFEKTNPFVFSLNYLWYYPVFALVASIIVSQLIPEGYFIMWMLGTLFTLPLYAGFTALRTPQKKVMEEESFPIDALALSEETGKTKTGEEGDEWLQHVAIGPRGSFLTAGERAQVAFARAAYCPRSDLVLLDDPFSSVDGVTGGRIMDNLVHSPLFHGRARVVALPPHSEHLRMFDRILVLKKGKIVEEGKPDIVFQSEAFGKLHEKQQKTSATPSTLAVSAPPRKIDASALPSEVRETQGTHKWSAIVETATSGGPRRLVLAAIVVLLLRVVVLGQILLLGMWADHKEAVIHTTLLDQDAARPDDDTFYIHVMAAGIIFAGALQVAQNYLVLSFNNSASTTLFNQVFSSLLRAPIDAFWGKHSVGRIINRLSADTLTIDVSFSTGFLALSGFIFSVIVQQIYCLVIMPKWLALPMYLAMASFVLCCWNASTPLQYFSMIALSRCQDEQAYAASTVMSARAYRQQGKQITRFCSSASALVKPNFLGVACAKQWLVFRITFCFCFQCTVCMLFVIMRPNKFAIGTAAMIALSTFNILQDLDCFIDTLINSISVGIALQRLSEYLRKQRALPKEEHVERDGVAREIAQKLLLDGAGLQIEWLNCGYSGRAANAVGGVTVDLPAGSWLGVVGPAGAGKSALLLGISQMIEPRDGRVLLGSLDLRDCGHMQPELLRRIVHYVPEDPAIFHGTIRFNVDPSGELSDEHVCEALRRAQLLSAIRELPGGLDYVVSKDAGALSVGQKQLLCLARAICEEPSLLLLDGSLSAIDKATQNAAYAAVAAGLRKTTVVVAARRVENVAGFDQVLLLDKGVVVEQGPVEDLLANDSSSFAAAFGRTGRTLSSASSSSPV